MKGTNKMTVEEFREMRDERAEIQKILDIDDVYFILIRAMGKKLKNELNRRLEEINEKTKDYRLVFNKDKNIWDLKSQNRENES